MKHDHKKDLKDLLTGMAPPPPPSDLKAKIKEEIPPTFRFEASKRAAGWGREAWLVAATLILVVGASLVSLRTIEIMEQEKAESFAIEAQGGAGTIDSYLEAMEPTPVEQDTHKAVASAKAAVAEEVSRPDSSSSREFAQSSPSPVASARESREKLDSPAPAETPAAPMRQVMIDQATRAEGNEKKAESESALADAMTFGSALSDDDRASHSEEAPMAKTSRGGRLRGSLTIGRSSVHSVKASLGSGRLPSPTTVHVEELVNYFAPPLESPTTGDFVLLTDGGPSLTPTDPRTRFLRVSVASRSGHELEVIANDVSLDASFNPSFVEASEEIGAGATGRSPSRLVAGETVSVLFRVRLTEGVSPGSPLGSIRLTWTGREGTPRSIDKTLFGADLLKPWEESTNGFRVATIAASWGTALLDRDATSADQIDMLVRLTDEIARSSGAAKPPRLDELRSLLAMTATVLRE